MAENISNIDFSMVSKAVHFFPYLSVRQNACSMLLVYTSTVENAQCAVSKASMNHTATYAVGDDAIRQG
jgi:hypothetical protein